MAEANAPTPTQDERILAALSHASALMPMMGVIAPIIIWATQKNTSRFVAFQSLQAIAYQLRMIVAWFIGMACYFLSSIGVFLFAALASGSSGAEPAVLATEAVFLFPFLVFGAMLVGGFLFIAYAVIAALMTLQGKPFRYVIIGSAVERFMQPAPELS